MGRVGVGSGEWGVGEMRRITNAQYFSTRGYANDFAVPERSRRAVQVPHPNF